MCAFGFELDRPAGSMDGGPFASCATPTLCPGDIMQRAHVLRAAILVAGIAVGTARADAQTTVGADLSLFSSYVWRGLSLTNKPVAQPDRGSSAVSC